MTKPGEHLDPEGTAVGTAVVLSEAEKKSILDAHNTFRARHGAPAVIWNADAANGGKYGENLAAGHKNFTTAIQGWYDEVNKYNFNKPGFGSGTGHFTQVVWKRTKTIGCVRRTCPKWTMYICEYDPPGNIATWDNLYFRDNVTPRQW
ncbi:hypothetical protein BGW39_003458 [Mortierella sp. 14UC]|nr:hypothetical protein BGW39_003458 [Mortierella sp. 14UC]